MEYFIFCAVTANKQFWETVNFLPSDNVESSEKFVSVFGLILVDICPHLENDQMGENAGKIWTRITPNTDTFYAVSSKARKLHNF